MASVILKCEEFRFGVRRKSDSGFCYHMGSKDEPNYFENADAFVAAYVRASTKELLKDVGIY